VAFASTARPIPRYQVRRVGFPGFPPGSAGRCQKNEHVEPPVARESWERLPPCRRSIAGAPRRAAAHDRARRRNRNRQGSHRQAIHKLSRRGQRVLRARPIAAPHENFSRANSGHIRFVYRAWPTSRAQFERTHGGTSFRRDQQPLAANAVKSSVHQERELERVGDSKTIRVDVRVIPERQTPRWKPVEEGVQ